MLLLLTSLTATSVRPCTAVTLKNSFKNQNYDARTLFFFRLESSKRDSTRDPSPASGSRAGLTGQHTQTSGRKTSAGNTTAWSRTCQWRGRWFVGVLVAVWAEIVHYVAYQETKVVFAITSFTLDIDRAEIGRPIGRTMRLARDRQS